MPYVQCEEAGCDYPDLCTSASSADEARQFLAAARAASTAEELALLVWEASGLLKLGRVKIYVPTKFLGGPLTERSVRVSRETLSQVNLHLGELASKN